jgi:hypothetical protein
VVKRANVDPALTFGASLVLSVVLWLPTLRETMNGNIEITDAGIRYVIALAIAWAGVFGVSSLVAMYASTTRRPPSATPPDPAASAPVRARRASDARAALNDGTETAETDAA